MSDVASDLSESISEVHGPRPCAPHLSLCTFLGISLGTVYTPLPPCSPMHLPHASRIHRHASVMAPYMQPDPSQPRIPPVLDVFALELEPLPWPCS